MTKAEKILVGFLSLILVGVGIIVFKEPVVVEKPLGIAVSEPSFGASNVTENSLTCKNDAVAGAVSVASATPGRMSFRVWTNSPTITSICSNDSGNCTATSGIAIAASSSLSAIYEQVDAYTGGYSCMGRGATTTIFFRQAR